jgi:hypothetical protein
MKKILNHNETVCSNRNLRLFSISMDGCLCLWLFVQGELYPTELITLPFQGDNKLQDNNFGTLALTGMHWQHKHILF